MKSTKFDASQLIRAARRASTSLRDDLAKTYPPIPAGWQTSAQMAKSQDMSLDQVQRALRKLIAAGIYEMKSWNVIEASGVFKPHPIYRKKP